MRSAVKKVNWSAAKWNVTRCEKRNQDVSRYIRQLPNHGTSTSRFPDIFFFVRGELWKARVLPVSQKSQWLQMPWNGGAQRVTHLDAVVMEVRVGQKLIGGVVHVRGQELTHKVAVDVRLGRHVVGEAKQVIHAHMCADFHCVNEVRSDLCAV